MLCQSPTGVPGKINIVYPGSSNVHPVYKKDIVLGTDKIIISWDWDFVTVSKSVRKH